MRRAGRLVLVVVCALGLGGCVNPDGFSFKSAYDQPQLFAATGPVAVDVTSFNGNVSIITDPTAEYLSVRVRRRATHGYGRSTDAKDALTRVYCTAEMVRQESGLVLKIKTWTDDPEPYFLRADLRIRLPDLSSVFVQTQNGRVDAYDFDGPVSVQTTDGRVHLETRAAIVQSVTVLNRRGDIEYQVGGGSSGDFDCQAVGGDVDQRVRVGRLIILPGTDADTLLATLNDGENSVQLHTTEGDVTIAVENLAPGIGPPDIYR